MKAYAYDVFAFRQQEEVNIQATFTACADEILDWVGVPRKLDNLSTGYQRFLDKNRIDQERLPFFQSPIFQNPKNSSPTASQLVLRRDLGLGKCISDPRNLEFLQAEIPLTPINFGRIMQAWGISASFYHSLFRQNIYQTY